MKNPPGGSKQLTEEELKKKEEELGKKERELKKKEQEGASRGRGISDWQLAWIVFMFMIISAVGLLAVVCLPIPYYSLPLIVVFGLIFFVCGLTIVSVLLSRSMLGIKLEGLGLPTGSVRALIALSLIVIFAIMVIFMYGNLQPTPQTIVANVTTINPNGTITSILNSTQIFVDPSPAQKDFSLQTLTTVSTLVVAISSFYFGAKSVKTAFEAVKGEAGGEKKAEGGKKGLTISYEGEPKAEIGGKEFEITVKTTPEDQATVGKVVDDDEQTLHQIGNHYKYKPSEKAKETVYLMFAPLKHTEAEWTSVEVKVTKPEEKKPPPAAPAAAPAEEKKPPE